MCLIEASAYRRKFAFRALTRVSASRACLTAHEGSHIINEAMTTIAL